MALLSLSRPGLALPGFLLTGLLLPGLLSPGLLLPGLLLPGLLLPGRASADEAAERLAKFELTPLELARLEREGWYLTEILIFVQGDEAGPGAEFWDPLPALSYPEDYRYPIEPRRLDRRADEVPALASRVDARGVQSVTVPRPVTGLDLAPREDVLINEPFLPEDPNAQDPNAQDANAQDPNAVDRDPPRRAGDLVGTGTSKRVADPNAASAEPRRLLKALPYALLERDQLEFLAQARTLRGRGQRVLFHGAWWARLREGGSPPPLVVDRAADPDTDAWPELQGSIRLYRSRYLHIELDLWLNTPGSYLPPGWRMEPAPLPEPSLRRVALDGRPLDPRNPPPALDAGPDAALPGTGEPPRSPGGRDGGLSSAGGGLSAGGGGLSVAGGGLSVGGARLSARGGGRAAGIDTSLAEAAPAGDENPAAAGPPWPWKHAIVHRQARRMRSNEVHYLDHPVIGVVVKVRPVSEDLLPLERDQDAAAWRERHGLPLDYLEIAPGDEP